MPAMADPWSIYRALIDGVPQGITVTRALVNRWAAVGTDAGTMGIAMAYDMGPQASFDEWNVVGRELREVAGYACSWDLRLASIGVAALNAWYSTEEQLAQLPGVDYGKQSDYFTKHPEVGSRPTAVVGHFREIDQASGDIVVLERRTRGNDLPDSACEFVIPECEVVIITGSAIVNKTMPRLLDLASAAEVHLVGPSTPPALGVYPACVREIGGSFVVDPDECYRLAGLGTHKLISSPAFQRYSLSL